MEAVARPGWRVARGLKLLSWGDASGDVVFSGRSRTTHLIDANAGAVLQTILSLGGTATTTQLLDELRSLPPAEAIASASGEQEQQESAALGTCLQGLLEVGLVLALTDQSS